MRALKFLVAGAIALVAIGTAAQRTMPLEPPMKTEASAPVPTPPAGTAALTAQDVNAWLDGFMPYGLAEADIAGAVVTVVQNGQVIAERGYG